MTRDALLTRHGWAADAIELVPMVASGDRIQDRALADVGGKALWTRELDRALDAGVIDAAVHSMKDVETIRPPQFAIAAMLPRADVRDRLIGAASIDALAHGARVGTSSPRRAAQLRRLRPDLDIVLFRGNVATRLGKLERGEADATLLAAAGLDRLAMPDTGTPIAVDTMLPAPSQGAVGIEVAVAHTAAREAIAAIDHEATHRCVMLERALLAELGADCRSPVAALAVEQDDHIWLRAEILAMDGHACSAGDDRISDADGARALAQRLLAGAAPEVRALFAG